MKQFFLSAVSLLIISPVALIAQSPELPPIQIDRSNNTFTPTLVAKGFIQTESGLLGESSNGVLGFSTPTLLLKYGVNKKFELRLGTALLWQESASSTLGMPPLSAGIKAALADEKGVIPQVSIISELILDEVATSNYKTKYLAPRLRLLFQHTLSKKFSLGYNLGVEWDGMGPQPTGVYTVCGNYNVTDKLCVFAEVFGEKPQNLPAAHYADAGLMFLLNNHSIADISGGVNIAGAAFPAIGRYYYAALGYSFRINTVKKVETIFVR